LSGVIDRIRNFAASKSLGAVVVKAVTGAAWVRLVGMGLGFLVGVQLARGLGVEGYGTYGVAMSIISLLGVPTEFGLPQLVTREVAAAHARKEWVSLAGVVWWSKRVVVVLAALVLLAMAGWLAYSGQGLSSSTGRAVMAGLLMVPHVAFGKIQGAILRGLHHLVKGQMPDALIRPAAYSVLLFLVSILSVPLTPAVAMMLACGAAGLACIVGAGMLFGKVPRLKGVRPETEAVRSWWRSAVPMAITQGMRVLQGNLVILLLGIMMTAASVGIYRIANSIIVLVAVPTTIFTLVASPIISSLYSKGDMATLQRLLTWITSGMVVSTAVISLPFLVAGSHLLTMFFGQEFAAAEDVLKIMCIGAVLTASAGTAGTLLAMTKHEGRVTRASMISLVVLLAVLPVLAGFFGVIGAAVASVVSMAVWRYLMVRDCRQLLGLETTMAPVLGMLRNPRS
jgi:O-antigen/teichoic acid export membrane protein